MRLDTLHLVRYGHFTDRTLSFDHHKDGAPDLHVVYGPNEAGKSTLSNAIIDLLFGIETRSPYAFKHKLATLEIASVLNSKASDEKLSVKRIRGGLVDNEGNSLDNSAIDTQNLSRNDYQSRFWFDDETLHKGGDSILSNKGELGAALFAASTGLNTITEQLDALMLPTDAFYKPNKRTQLRSKTIKEELKKLQTEIKTHETNRSAWKRLLKQQDSLQETVSANRETIQAIQNERQKLERNLRALTLFNRWEINSQNDSKLSDLPSVPAHWIPDFTRLVEQYNSCQSALQDLTEELKPIENELSQVSVSADWLQYKSHIERIKLSSEVLNNTQAQLASISIRHNEMQQLLANNAAALSSLPGHPADATEPLSALHITTIDNVLPALISTKEQHAALQTTFDLKKERIASITNSLSDQTIATGSEAFISQLTQFIESSDVTDALAGYEHVNQQLKELERDVVESEVALKAVTLEETTDYHSVPVPSTPAIRAAVSAIKDAHHRIDTTQVSIDALQNDIHANEKKLKSLGYTTTGEVMTLSSAQLQLEEHWSKLKLSLSENADRKQLSTDIEHVDQSVASIRESLEPALAYAKNQGAIDAILSSTTHLQTQLETARAEREAAIEHLTQLDKQHQDQLKHLPGLSYSDETSLVSWRESLEKWRKADAKRLAQTLALDSAQAQCSELNDELVTLLEHNAALLPKAIASSTTIKRLHEPTPEQGSDNKNIHRALKNNYQQAHRILAALRDQQNLINTENAKIAEIQQDLDETEQRLIELSRAREVASESILSVAQDSWLSELTIDAIASHWGSIKERSELLKQLKELDQHKTRAEQTITELTKPILEITEQLNVNPSSDVLEKLDALLNLHEVESDKHGAQQRLLTQKAQLTQQTQKHFATVESVKTQLEPFYKALNCSDIETLRAKFTDLQIRQELQSNQALIESDICELLSVSSFAQAQAELFSLGQPITSESSEAELRSQLQQRLTQLNIELTAAETEHLNNNADLQQVAREIKAMSLDEKTAELRQTEADLAQELEEGVMQALKYRLGYIAIKRGLQHYRDANQSELMEAAENAFSALTHNRYAKLFTRPDNKGVEKLYATRENGDTVSADQLSTGTRYQLYLALRIAAYHQYRRQREPLPFIADDIFETFDDARTQSALTQMASMGMHGQVIYFTHHAHVVDIAKRVVPSVNTIEL